MAQFTLQRHHALGVSGARQLARQWAERARRDHGTDCRITHEDGCERVHFERAGVQGELVATAEQFTVNVTLGFLLSAFSDRIRSEIEKNLDAAMAQAAGGSASAATT